jgi:UPF0176 protein
VKPILNVSAYRFVELADAAGWAERIRVEAERCSLKGTLLLAEEGINLVVAGNAAAVSDFMAWLAAQAPFAGLEQKTSWSDSVPFRKLVVKVKPEIIRMNHPTIRPQQGRAPALAPQTLKRWLDTGVDDAGRPVVTLDARNAFEVAHGRFRAAHDWRIARFSDFPGALQQHRAELEGKTVVSYCTGGIRCEKAALLMQQAGLADVWQLDGGILNYLEQTGGTHFEGNCFVFDQRAALDDTLAPAGVASAPG